MNDNKVEKEMMATIQLENQCLGATPTSENPISTGIPAEGKSFDALHQLGTNHFNVDKPGPCVRKTMSDKNSLHERTEEDNHCSTQFVRQVKQGGPGCRNFDRQPHHNRTKAYSTGKQSNIMLIFVLSMIRLTDAIQRDEPMTTSCYDTFAPSIVHKDAQQAGASSMRRNIWTLEGNHTNVFGGATPTSNCSHFDLRTSASWMHMHKRADLDGRIMRDEEMHMPLWPKNNISHCIPHTICYDTNWVAFWYMDEVAHAVYKESASLNNWFSDQRGRKSRGPPAQKWRNKILFYGDVFDSTKGYPGEGPTPIFTNPPPRDSSYVKPPRLTNADLLPEEWKPSKLERVSRKYRQRPPPDPPSLSYISARSHYKNLHEELRGLKFRHNNVVNKNGGRGTHKAADFVKTASATFIWKVIHKFYENQAINYSGWGTQKTTAFVKLVTATPTWKGNSSPLQNRATCPEPSIGKAEGKSPQPAQTPAQRSTEKIRLLRATRGRGASDAAELESKKWKYDCNTRTSHFRPTAKDLLPSDDQRVLDALAELNILDGPDTRLSAEERKEKSRYVQPTYSDEDERTSSDEESSDEESSDEEIEIQPANTPRRAHNNISLRYRRALRKGRQQKQTAPLSPSIEGLGTGTGEAATKATTQVATPEDTTRAQGTSTVSVKETPTQRRGIRESSTIIEPIQTPAHERASGITIIGRDTATTPKANYGLAVHEGITPASTLPSHRSTSSAKQHKQSARDATLLPPLKQEGGVMTPVCPAAPTNHATVDSGKVGRTSKPKWVKGEKRRLAPNADYDANERNGPYPKGTDGHPGIGSMIILMILLLHRMNGGEPTDKSIAAQRHTWRRTNPPWSSRHTTLSRDWREEQQSYKSYFSHHPPVGKDRMVGTTMVPTLDPLSLHGAHGSGQLGPNSPFYSENRVRKWPPWPQIGPQA
jgi:hypothetical protein